ncbi:hypothetical protein BDV23DRAFT_154507 [Aspergillus alliaceus]|uniref:Uncharacterized protein n=1 Tax=Petromyces alliaceus TaxID=209559 RepID=A0A5N6FFF8_PETAA|nr:uncharacterized protein BDW43DRAFT_293706 [Aspergillus alliaceus]KAB8227570.1 hypothetical protein BDW43DRAFT_293706 [Aspergillus alliaceus]KAE8390840.1 hypothetical protein BDV23DRAFT_154507 [Aspergillus alliaceus]
MRPQDFFFLLVLGIIFFGPLPLSCSPVLCFFVTRLSFPCLWDFFYLFLLIVVFFFLSLLFSISPEGGTLRDRWRN